MTVQWPQHLMLCSLQLDMQRFCGLGSDGASVMLGTRGGVSRIEFLSLLLTIALLIGLH